MSNTLSNMSFVPLPGSERRPIPSAVPAGSLDESERIEITIVTRRKAELPRTASGVPVRLSRDELRQQHGSDPADQALVTDVLTGLGLGLEVTSRDPGSRRLKVVGPVSALARAFGTTLSLVTSTGPGQSRPVTHRYRQGGLQIPAELAGVVVAVLGLDNRPQARPHVRRAELAAQQVQYTPPQVAAIYQFPEGTDGTGQTIAIIELGGGFADTDLDTYFPSLGLAVPSVTVVGVDGASNGGGQDPPQEYVEVALDIEVAGSVAPGAALVVYFAPNTSQGWLDGVSEAIQATPTPTAVSISWGGTEDSSDPAADAALEAVFADAVALGVTVCVSSGDAGSSDGATDGNPHCEFPASSPHVLACGGTSLQADPATGVISSETVWNDGSGASGGGVSEVFALPAWQGAAGVPANPVGGTGRGVPDVAGNADPGTGYLILLNNNWLLGGGTSAVAPLWAALTSRLTQAAGRPLGFLPEQLYAGVQPAVPAPGFFDITQGNNGAYSAGPGWDACTGLGSPNGSALLGPRIDIIELQLQSGSWTQADLTDIISTPPAVPAASAPFALTTSDGPPDGTPRVFYTGDNGHIIELQLDSGSWIQGDLTAVTGAGPATAGPFAYVTPADGVLRIVYTDGNGDIIELRLEDGGWLLTNLTASVTDNQPAPAAASGPFALTPPDNLPRVYYTSTTGDIIELRLDPDGWISGDLTISVSPPAAPAASGPFAYMTPGGVLRVLYTDKNGDIIELQLDSDSAGWIQTSLTASVTDNQPAPAAASGPVALTPPDNLPRVYYTSTTGDIIELRLDPDGWISGDLTISVSPPAAPAASGPFAYMTPGGVLRVLYCDGNGDVIELQLDSDSAGWIQTSLTASVTPPAPAVFSGPAFLGPFAYTSLDGVPRVYYSSRP